MNRSIQKRFISVFSLGKLIKGYIVLRKARRNPTCWIEAQNKEIKRFVEYIYGIPFYRRRFDEAGVKPTDIKKREDFSKLPVLTKQEYRAWLLEETKDKDKCKGWMYRQTTGSSGTPLDLYSLPTDRAAEIANLMRCAIIQRKGYNPFLDRVFITMVPKPPKRKRISIPFKEKMSSISSPKDLVEGYNKARPDFYYGNKTAVLSIAQYALDHNIPLHEAKCVGSISEALDDSARNVINKAFGERKLFDIYGCAEIGNFAVDLADEPGKHTIWNDTHCVNLYNSEAVEGYDNVYRGQLMITSLVHRGFPLVNYLVGDNIELTVENGVPYITKIIGRSNDVIKNRDGSSYKWMHINRIMFGFTDVLQFRIIQKSYSDLLFVLAVPESTSDERKKEIECLVRERAESVFGKDLDTTGKTISFEWSNRIPPDPTGKVRILISEV